MRFKEKIIDKVIYFLFLSLFLFTPLIMTSVTSELFEFNKMILIYTLTTLVLFLWILKMIILKKIVFIRTPFDIFIFLFLISQIISTVLSIDPHTSFFGYYGRFNGGLLSIFSYLILFYALVSNVEKNKIFRLLKTSLITSLIVILWGLPGKIGYDLSCLLFTGKLNNACWTEQFKPAERMFSTLGQPNWLGAYLSIIFFIGVYFFIFAKKKSSQWFYLIYLFLNFSSILFTRSRSALLATIFCFFLFIFFILINYNQFSAENRNFKKHLFQFSFIFLAVFLSVLLFKTGIEKIDRYLRFDLNKKSNTQQKNQIKNISPPIKVTESLDIRKIVWKGAVELGKKYPFFGTGVETFAYAYYFVRPKEHNLTSEWDYLYNKAHNEYLNYFATAGFVGLITYLFFIFSVIFYFLKVILKKDNETKKIKENINDEMQIKLINVSLLMSYITILITNFFGFSTTTINLYFYLIPGLTFLINKKDIKRERFFEEEFKNLNSIQFFQLIVLILFTFLSLFYIFKYWYADTLYAKADIYQRAGYYQEASQFLHQALKLKYEHVYEDKLSHNLANFAYNVYYQKGANIADDLIKLSEYYNKKSIKASPKNVIYLKTKSKNLYLFYQIKLDKKYLIEGIKTLNDAFNLSPTDPKIPYTKAIFYSIFENDEKNKNEKEKYRKLILKNLDLATELKPDFRDAYFLKGRLLKSYKKNEEAKKVFQFILNNINPFDQEAKEELKNI